MNSIESRVALAGILLEKVRQERYPSSTQMTIIEEVLPPQLLSRYVEVLLEKVAQDERPSIPMLHRIQRVIDRMP
jgi:nucleoside-triphosphatase THEP1